MTSITERCRQEPAADARADPALVLTRGNGPHLDALCDRYPRAIVLSPVAASSGLERRGRILVVPEARDRAGAVLRSLLVLGLDVREAAPTGAGAEGAERDPRLDLAACRRSARVERETLLALADAWLDNLSANLGKVLDATSTHDVAGVLGGRPVLAVGRGPSLEGFLPTLRSLRDRVCLVAANSAVRPLAGAGIVPDGVVVIEGRDCSRDFEGLPRPIFERAVLFAEATTHPAHLDWPFREKVVFVGALGSWLTPWLGEAALVPTGGNAGTAALVLGWLLGGSPILAAGIDFALSADGVSGARGAPGEPVETVQGWSGESLIAELPYVSYREETEAILAAIRARDGLTPWLSVTSRGARIAGMEPVDWERLRAVLPSMGGPALAELTRVHRSAPRRHRVEALRGRVETILRIFDRVVDDPLGPAVGVALLDPPDPLIRALAVPALARAEAGGARPALEAARVRLVAMAEAAIRATRGAPRGDV